MAARKRLTLSDYLRSDYARRHLGMSESSLRQYAISLRLLEAWYSRGHTKRLYVADLTDGLLLDFLRHYRSGRSAPTTNSKRRQILTVWKDAAERGLCSAPGRIPRVREPALQPTAWWPEEFSLILGACRSPDLRAVLLVAWDTDCRISAILRGQRSKCDFRRRLVTLLEPKTQAEAVFLLSEATAVSLQALRHDGDWLFRIRNPRWLREQLLTPILKQLGLPHSSRDKFHRIRRTKYTQVYKRFGPIAATEHAGHRCDLSRHYLDRRQLATPEIVDSLPPPIAS